MAFFTVAEEIKKFTQKHGTRTKIIHFFYRISTIFNFQTLNKKNSMNPVNIFKFLLRTICEKPCT